MATVYVVALLGMSFATFVAYGLDKRRAGQGRRRVRESTLHWMALLGGWPGALAGQRFFRHKTKKLRFRVVLWLVAVAHVALVAGVAYLMI
jgi:uncharacterized membrane protein YsdA (DUF1294 family)